MLQILVCGRVSFIFYVSVSYHKWSPSCDSVRVRSVAHGLIGVLVLNESKCYFKMCASGFGQNCTTNFSSMIRGPLHPLRNKNTLYSYMHMLTLFCWRFLCWCSLALLVLVCHSCASTWFPRIHVPIVCFRTAFVCSMPGWRRAGILRHGVNG